jgi:acyl-coenzyme A thioesterase PaaI-like protein
MRELGHEFVGRALSDEQLDIVRQGVASLLVELRTAPMRVREFSRDGDNNFALTIPTFEQDDDRLVFTDSFVSGAANPVGLAARLWRDGDVACMRVTLGRAFEGAPGRAHGGVVAALLDEVMGLVNVLHGAMAFTAQLDITYHAATPLGESIVARAWLERRVERKHYVQASLHANDELIVSAKALFITIDRDAFVEQFQPGEE